MKSFFSQTKETNRLVSIWIYHCQEKKTDLKISFLLRLMSLNFSGFFSRLLTHHHHCDIFSLSCLILPHWQTNRRKLRRVPWINADVSLHALVFLSSSPSDPSKYFFSFSFSTGEQKQRPIPSSRSSSSSPSPVRIVKQRRQKEQNTLDATKQHVHCCCWLNSKAM